jgi:hypothetical protein
LILDFCQLILVSFGEDNKEMLKKQESNLLAGLDISSSLVARTSKSLVRTSEWCMLLVR